MNAIVPAALVPTDMDQAIRLAKAMSSAKMLPKHLQDDVGTCLMIVEQAMRWQMSPFAVAQCTSNIGGKLMWEGKLVAAAVETSGAIEGHFDYEFKGEGEERQITISARRRGETSPRQMTIKLKDVRTSNEHWKKQPDQMLVYSGTRNWARRWTPAVILGVYAPEEFSRDGKPADAFDGTTIDHEAEPEQPDARDAINAEVPVRAAAAATPRPPRVSEETPPKRTIREVLAAIEIALRDAQTHEEANGIMCGEEVERARRVFTGEAKDRLEKALKEANTKWWPEEAPQDELPVDELVIHNEEKLAAG